MSPIIIFAIVSVNIQFQFYVYSYSSTYIIYNITTTLLYAFRIIVFILDQNVCVRLRHIYQRTFMIFFRDVQIILLVHVSGVQVQGTLYMYIKVKRPTISIDMKIIWKYLKSFHIEINYNILASASLSQSGTIFWAIAHWTRTIISSNTYFYNANAPKVRGGVGESKKKKMPLKSSPIRKNNSTTAILI